MEVKMTEPLRISVAAISAETRNKVEKPIQRMIQLTQSIGNISISSSTDDGILKEGIPENLIETHINKSVEESSNKGTICEAWLKRLYKKGKTCEFFHDEHISQMPGCYMCLTYNGCYDKDCMWCVRGFCHNGSLCNNIYAQYLYYKDEEVPWQHNTLSRIRPCILKGKLGPYKGRRNTNRKIICTAMFNSANIRKHEYYSKCGIPMNQKYKN